MERPNCRRNWWSILKETLSESEITESSGQSEKVKLELFWDGGGGCTNWWIEDKSLRSILVPCLRTESRSQPLHYSSTSTTPHTSPGPGSRRTGTLQPPCNNPPACTGGSSLSILSSRGPSHVCLQINLFWLWTSWPVSSLSWSVSSLSLILYSYRDSNCNDSKATVSAFMPQKVLTHKTQRKQELA